MFDGMARTLREVRHIPNLKKNLISFRALDLNGYIFTITGGVLKVTKEIMVIMKRKDK